MMEFLDVPIIDIAALDQCDFTLLAFLQHSKLLPSEKLCIKCGNKCNIVKKNRVFSFKCHRSFDSVKCNFSVTLNKDTWFDHAGITYTQILSIIYCFVSSINQKTTGELLKVNQRTLVDYYKFCREVCIASIISEVIELIGGPNTIVDFDESKIGYQKSKCCKAIKGPWVFGAVQRNSRNCFFVPFDKCDKATLLHIITERIRPGTKIISDCWKSYKCLSDQRFHQLTISHGITFSTPETEAHTSTMDSEWWAIKNSLPISGQKKSIFIGHLATFIWKRKHKGSLFSQFIKDIAKLYYLRARQKELMQLTEKRQHVRSTSSNPEEENSIFFKTEFDEGNFEYANINENSHPVRASNGIKIERPSSSTFYSGNSSFADTAPSVEDLTCNVCGTVFNNWKDLKKDLLLHVKQEQTKNKELLQANYSCNTEINNFRKKLHIFHEVESNFKENTYHDGDELS